MRDSYVVIPGHGQDKINAAYSYGGIELLNQTLKENFKFEAPYYASITFQNFIDCVDELFPNGVKIEAEKDLDLDGVYIKKGKQIMDGIILSCSMHGLEKMKKVTLDGSEDNNK